MAAALGTAVLALSGCGGGDEETVRPEQLAAEGAELIVFELNSTAFGNSTEIPVRYTCDGEDLSPPLAWADAPAGTAALALLVDDPDAPGGQFTHWLGWGLDASVGRHPEGSPAPVEGKNGFGSTGYRGPCPPKGDGPHRYVFRLFALDSELELSDGADKKAFQEALQGHVLGTAELVGSYARR